MDWWVWVEGADEHWTAKEMIMRLDGHMAGMRREANEGELQRKPHVVSPKQE